MSDIRGFTPLAESLDPESTLAILNLYLGRMIEVIKRNHGIIVDFFGDGVLVFFDPLDRPLGPTLANALECALDMQAEMTVINKELAARGLPALETGIGLNTGPVVVGNIGSETRAKYGIVGSAVNLTQRIQDQAGPGEIVLSDAVRAGIKQPMEIRRTFEVSLKGLHGEQKLHVLGKTGPSNHFNASSSRFDET
jgi:class 3 adenylate cyclase